MPFFSQYSLLLQKKTVRPTSLDTRKGHYMTSTQWILDSIDVLNEYLWTYVVIVMLVGCAIYFTVRSRGVQFRLLKDMVKIIVIVSNHASMRCARLLFFISSSFFFAINLE